MIDSCLTRVTGQQGTRIQGAGVHYERCAGRDAYMPVFHWTAATTAQDRRLSVSAAVIQRVKSASVTVDNQLVSSIGRGLLVLAGVGKGDDEKEADTLIAKLLKTRFWTDENGAQVGLAGVSTVHVDDTY